MAKYYFTDSVRVQKTSAADVDSRVIGVRSFDQARCEAIRHLTHLRTADLPAGKETVLRILCEEVPDEQGAGSEGPGSQG